MKKFFTLFAATAALLLTGCQDDAQVVNHNITKAADNFEVLRRITMFNGITGDNLLVLSGLCNITADRADNQLEVICKSTDPVTKETGYQKHFLGLSDNVSYIVEQSEKIDVSVYHTRITFKPQAIIPDIDFRGSTTDLPRNQE